MNTLHLNFNKAYPVFSSMKFHDRCVIEEPDNKDRNALQQLELTGFDGYDFPHDLVSQTASFASAAQKNAGLPESHSDVMRLNCDKVILFEREGQKHILFCELKSSFSSDEIAHAKDQIVGSLVKIRSLFQSLQGFDAKEYKYIGLIASFKPTEEQLNALSKLNDKKSSFAVMLNAHGKYSMSSQKMDDFFYPLSVGAMELYYLGVPQRQKTYSVDINTIL